MRRRYGGNPIEFQFSRKFSWGSPFVQVRVRESARPIRSSWCAQQEAGFRRVGNVLPFPINMWRPFTSEVRGRVFETRRSGILTPVLNGPFSGDMKVMARLFWAPVAEAVIEKVRPFREYMKEVIRMGDSL